MTYTYRVTKDAEGLTAACVEMPVSVTSSTEREAIAALHAAIVEHLTRVEAVAPPSMVAVPSVRLVPAQDVRAEDAPTEPQGPGDSPAAENV